MTGNRIWQLPNTTSRGKCPVCFSVIKMYKPYTVAVNKFNIKTSKTEITFRECNVLYCAKCDLPLVGGTVNKQIRDTYFGWITTFSPKGKCTAESLRNQMYSKPPNVTLQQVQDGPFELVERRTVQPENIIGLSEETSNCTKCDRRLIDAFVYIPVDDDMCRRIPAKRCLFCNRTYVSNVAEVEKVMRDNPYSNGFTLNGRALYHTTRAERKRLKREKEPEIREERIELQKLRAEKDKVLEQERARKKRLSEIDGAVMMLCVEFSDQVLEEYIITTNKWRRYYDQSVFYYGSSVGLELISAAFAKQRDKAGELQNRSFKVLQIVYKDDDSDKQFGQRLLVELEIKKGGGYYSSEKNEQHELIDVLLYSPFYNRYEIIRATLDKEENYCFSDAGLYRDFVHEYGNPGIRLTFSGGFSSYGNYFNELRDRSILREWGYTVSQKDNPGRRIRQQTLADAIDMKVMEIPKIISHIDFCIRLHSSDKDYYARQLWLEDREFVKNYKANPERFLIAKIGSRR